MWWSKRLSEAYSNIWLDDYAGFVTFPRAASSSLIATELRSQPKATAQAASATSCSCSILALQLPQEFQVGSSASPPTAPRRRFTVSVIASHVCAVLELPQINATAVAAGTAVHGHRHLAVDLFPVSVTGFLHTESFSQCTADSVDCHLGRPREVGGHSAAASEPLESYMGISSHRCLHTGKQPRRQRRCAGRVGDGAAGGKRHRRQGQRARGGLRRRTRNGGHYSPCIKPCFAS